MADALNETIAGKLCEMADALEQQQADGFRISAYRRAAATVESLGSSIGDIAHADGLSGLMALPAIGCGIACAIMEMLSTGRWSQLERLGLDRKHAYKVLCATLHAVRDRIGPDNAVHLGAQLPILVRGFYYEGWHAASTPTKIRHKQDFLDYVSGDVFRGLGIDPETAVRAVFEVMTNRLDPGEVEKLIKLFPDELRSLWPATRHGGGW